MKNTFSVLLCFFLFSLVKAQTPYISFKDEKHPDQTILNGIVTKYILENTPEYKWYISSRSSYSPDSSVLNAMESSKGKIQFVLFGGTWCDDTQFVLPKFFKLQEMSGVPDASISFFAVNRNKKTLGNLAEAFSIINVPTIIVMKDGKEVGRVVEYGKTGKWDIELAGFLR